MRRIFFSLSMAVLITFACVQSSLATSFIPLKTAWQSEHEAFVLWYALQRGWDKDMGLDISMLRFDSGKAIIDGMTAYNWAVAGCGAMPALRNPFDQEFDIIAIGNDESTANAVYVRPDSPILKVQGSNPAYPKVYGDKDSLRGKVILCPQDTSAAYMTDVWLKSLGLTHNDVHLKHMSPEQALGAFKAGMGDAVALWAPRTYEAEKKGWKVATLSKDCDATQPILIVANHAYATQHPEHIEGFLRVYMRGIEQIKETPPEDMAAEYVRFFKEWGGKDISTDEAIMDLRTHPVFTVAEQLAMFDTAKGKSKIQQWLAAIVHFYITTDGVEQKKRDRLQRLYNVTDVYLKAIR